MDLRDLLKQVKRMAEEQELVGNYPSPDMIFPPVKFVKTNTLREQLAHIKSELVELEAEIDKLEQHEKYTDEYNDQAYAVGMEATDLIHSTITLMYMVRQKFQFFATEVTMKNMERDYYSDTISPEQKAEALRLHKISSDMRKLKKKQQKEVIETIGGVELRKALDQEIPKIFEETGDPALAFKRFKEIMAEHKQSLGFDLNLDDCEGKGDCENCDNDHGVNSMVDEIMKKIKFH